MKGIGIVKNNVFSILNGFSHQFSDRRAFFWFIVIIFGFILRFDHHGVTSFVRWLGLLPNTYPLLLNFFHASSWDLGRLMTQWMQWSISNFPIVRVNGRIVCLGDGIKISKEAKKQPGLADLHEKSGNSGKPEKFIGQYFGCIAFVMEKFGRFYGILQAAEMQQGVDDLRKSIGEKVDDSTLVTRMVTMVVIIASIQGIPFYLCLDAFFATSPAFAVAALHLMADGTPWVHIITKAKSSYVGYTTQEKQKRKSGGIKLWSLFGQAGLFQPAPHPTHPERQILYYSIDLYWCSVVNLIRFVLIIDGKRRFILMCSDIRLEPLNILKCYALRSKIEVNFLTLKHIIGGFCYRFWTKCLPKFEKGNQAVLSDSEDAECVKNALKTLMSIERFVNLAIIAQGILQYMAIIHTAIIWEIHKATSWLRTYSSDMPSVEVVQRVLQAGTLLNCKVPFYAWIESLVGQDGKPKLPSKVPKDGTLGRIFLSQK